MKYTSQEANKVLKKLNDEYHSILLEEQQASTFVAAMGEDVESVRPEYDYQEVQKTLAELEKKIILVKHAINVFNATHKLAGFDMTIDEALVYIPQLSRRVTKLQNMKSVLPKARANAYPTGNIIDYTYANYDRDAVKADYDKAFDELAKLQMALDQVNSNETMEIDL